MDQQYVDAKLDLEVKPIDEKLSSITFTCSGLPHKDAQHLAAHIVGAINDFQEEIGASGQTREVLVDSKSGKVVSDKTRTLEGGKAKVEADPKLVN